jgi:hypothetical protein
MYPLLDVTFSLRLSVLASRVAVVGLDLTSHHRTLTFQCHLEKELSSSLYLGQLGSALDVIVCSL